MKAKEVFERLHGSGTGKSKLKAVARMVNRVGEKADGRKLLEESFHNPMIPEGTLAKMAEFAGVDRATLNRMARADYVIDERLPFVLACLDRIQEKTEYTPEDYLNMMAAEEAADRKARDDQKYDEEYLIDGEGGQVEADLLAEAHDRKPLKAGSGKK